MPELMEVLEFLDPTGHIIAVRIPEDGSTEIKWGAQLTVRESQVAIFSRDGKALDVFEAGRYILQTQNVPVVGKWVTSFGYGPKSPFRSEVYFLNLKLYPNLKWGTLEPILFKDTELKMIRLRSHGIFSIQIADPLVFLNKVVGTQSIFLDTHIEDYLKNIIVTKMTDVIGNEIKTIFDLPKDFNQLSLIIKSSLKLEFEGLGLYLHDFYINSISVPPDVQEMIDTKTGMTALGNLDEYMKFKTAKALEVAAENPTGTAGAGVGIGAGLGMGLMMPQFIQQAQQPQQISKEDSTASPFDKIKMLKELLDIGAITQEEYDLKKTKLMEEI